MKKTALSFLVICIAITTMQAQNEPVNPFEKYGYTPKIATLSKGKYVEFYDQDTIVQIGGAVFNTVTMKIMGFVEYDTIRNEYNISPEVISRWLSPDPLTSEFPSWSPYNYVENNPIRMVDPTGLSPDDYTVDDKGIVTDVKKTDDPNRFFDKKGNELTFNDIGVADKDMLNANFQKGDRLFFNVTKEKSTKAINEAGIDPFVQKLGGNYGIALFSAATSSHGKADFTFGFLSNEYSINKGGTDGDSFFRAGYPDQAGYFKFEGDNTIYNLYDAGNYLWGAWMKINSFTEIEAKTGAHMNELMNNQQYDTKADQKAISEGFKFEFK